MYWAAEISGDEEDCKKIEKSGKEPPGSVFGCAEFSWSVAYCNFADFEASPCGQNRNVAVHVAMKLQAGGEGGAVDFEATVNVVYAQAGKEPGDGVEQL